jgi:hypothetical protein
MALVQNYTLDVFNNWQAQHSTGHCKVALHLGKHYKSAVITGKALGRYTV